MGKDAIKFILKLSLFIVLFLVFFLSAAFIWASAPQWRFQFTDENTESNLLMMPSDEKFDVVILGASHGNGFSHHANHKPVERILKRKIINLSKGGGVGPLPEFLFLSYFYSQGNTTDVVLYVIDPLVFHSPQWNEKNFFLSDEPLSAKLLALALRHGVDRQVIYNYLKSKLSINWLLTKPAVVLRDDVSLSTVDKELVKRRIENLYPDGINNDYVPFPAAYMEKILRLANNNGARVMGIIPPTLLGNAPGHEDLIKLLEGWHRVYGTEFFDFSNVMQDPSFYRDHDHFNSKGVEVFTQKFIKPILR